ncbi:MAG: alpha/beta hydrolase [Clostridia bacterium]
MSTPPKLEKPRVPKRFYFLTLLVFLPIIYALAVIGARWYGFAVAALAFAWLLWVRHSPHWRGWHMVLCYLCAFLTAYGGLYFSRPRWDVSLPGQVGSGTLRLFMRLPMEESVRSGERFGEVSAWKPPEGYLATTVRLPSCSMEVLRKADVATPYALLQLHGGAFVSGLNDLYRVFARRYCDMTGGAAVFTLDYRLFPAYPYPSQQNDVMDAWIFLTQTLGYAPEQILLAGDSAGGNLVLNLCLRLRDSGSAMPLGMVAMSPWADLSNSGPSHVTNATNDPTFGLSKKDFDGSTPVGVPTTYIEGLHVRDPYLSPTFGDYIGFPPMLLQAGGEEILLSDSQLIAQNARAHGVDCTFTIYPGMFHVFQGSLDLLPESKDAWAEIAAFLKRLTSPLQP